MIAVQTTILFMGKEMLHAWCARHSESAQEGVKAHDETQGSLVQLYKQRFETLVDLSLPSFLWRPT